MNYPAQVSQAWLDNQRSADDRRVVRVELFGVFNYRPVPIPGKKNKRYIFLYDPKTACHVLKVPETLWMADNGAMARDLLRSNTHSYELVVLILPLYAAEPEKAKPLPVAPKSRKKVSAEDAAMAVLGG